MSLEGLADIAARKDDQPAIEAICLNPMRGGDPRARPRQSEWDWLRPQRFPGWGEGTTRRTGRAAAEAE